MKSGFNDVAGLYRNILFLFALNPGDELYFGTIIQYLRDKNNLAFDVRNADNELESPDFKISRGWRICLSNNQKAFVIEKKCKDEEHNMILVYFDNGRVMVSQEKSEIISITQNKDFTFDKNKRKKIPKYKPDLFLDEESNNNDNENDVINNVGNHSNNINRLDESQNHQNDIFNAEENMNEERRYQRPQPHPWSNICGRDLSCLDCCHCFGGRQSV